MGGGEGNPASGRVLEGDRLAAYDPRFRQEQLERGLGHGRTHARQVSDRADERGGCDAEVTREAAEAERARPEEGHDLAPAGKGRGRQIPVVVAALAGSTVGDGGPGMGGGVHQSNVSIATMGPQVAKGVPRAAIPGRPRLPSCRPGERQTDPPTVLTRNRPW